MGKYQTPIPSNVIISRDCFEKYGKFEDSFRNLFEDQVMFTKILLNVPVFVSDRLWILYRQHMGNSSIHMREPTRNIGELIKPRSLFYTWLKEYLIHHRVSNILVWIPVIKGLIYCRFPLLFKLTYLKHDIYNLFNLSNE